MNENADSWRSNFEVPSVKEANKNSGSKPGGVMLVVIEKAEKTDAGLCLRMYREGVGMMPTNAKKAAGV
jgi:hypothetical protein